MNHLPYILLIALLAGCIQTELPSSEADIVVFTLPDNVKPLELDVKENYVYIMISSADEQAISSIAPEIMLSKGAKMLPASGSIVNLNSVEYVVTAENGATKTYTISIAREYDSDTVRFAFNDWITSSNGYLQTADNNWSSGNAGITMALSILGREKAPANYPTQRAAGKAGDAAMLVTTAGGMIFGMNIAVWAGSFFLGNFNTSKVTTPLLATEFGRAYKRQPQRMRGYYKYREGADGYVFSFSKNDNATHTSERADSCAIYAVFYLSDGLTLDATNIASHPNIISRADIAHTQRGGAATGADFELFMLDFQPIIGAPAVDFSIHTYKLAVVFSSSAAGGTPSPADPSTIIYAGKIGSTLIVDEVEIINE